jgi:hypothetical protein
MNSIWIKSLALSAALTTALALPAHAIIGFGAHIAPEFGTTVKKSDGFIMPSSSSDPDRIRLMTGSSSGMSGVGVKLWIDFLPLIDVEGTVNMQVGYYDMAFAVDTAFVGGPSYDTIQVDPDFSIPFAQAKPFYGRISGDVALLYPFFKIPLLKVYAGGGLSYIAATPVLSSSFAKAALTKADAGGSFDAETADADDIREVLVDALKDEGMATGVGFFLQAGAKIKPPIIPLAVYANGKYAFGGPSVSGVDNGGLTLELGGALAF